MRFLRRLWARLCPIAIGRKAPETDQAQRVKSWGGMPVRYRKTYEGDARKLRGERVRGTVKSFDQWTVKHGHRRRSA